MISTAQSNGSQVISISKADLEKFAPGVAEKIQQTQLIKEQVQEAVKVLPKANEWAGIGKEVGIAVNEGLSAVTDQAQKFSETRPGKLTMVIIAWKVIGKDFTGLVLGIPMLILWTCLLIWIIKGNFVVRSVLSHIQSDGKKVYETVNKIDEWNEDKQIMFAITLIAFLVAFVLTIKSVIF